MTGTRRKKSTGEQARSGVSSAALLNKKHTLFHSAFHPLPSAFLHPVHLFESVLKKACDKVLAGGSFVLSHALFLRRERSAAGVIKQQGALVGISSAPCCFSIEPGLEDVFAQSSLCF
jgi:hypothetical protein